MRSTILIFIVFSSLNFFSCSELRAQPYFPIQDSSSWVTKGINWGGPPHTLYQSKTITLGDTVINSLSYLKLYFVGVNGMKFFVGGIRNDTLKRVYIFDNDSLKEYLLYDFGVKTGDTIVNAYNLNGDTLIVDTVITTPRNELPDSNKGLARTKIRLFVKNDNGFGPPIANQWIEGVGTNVGLFLLYMYELPFESQHWVQCFKVRDTAYFYKGECGFYGIEDQQNTYDLNFANPVSTSTRVYLDLLISKSDFSIKIYNALGRLEKVITKGRYDVLELSADEYSKGLHIIHFDNGNDISFTRKIVFL